MSQPTPVTGNNKPSLTGVRIKQRKGVAKANAKFEPEVFRDALLSHLEPIPFGSNELVATKLITAGTTLEMLKYSDALFETLLVGGLLQPGGSYIEDDTPRSTFAIVGGIDEQEGLTVGGGKPEAIAGKGKEWDEMIAEVSGKTEVLKKLIQRYKYLQKPLEKNVLPALLQYISKFTPLQRQKLSACAAILISSGLASSECLESLTKEHIVKDGLSLSFLTAFIRSYLSVSSMEHLSKVLKASFKDIISVMPPGKKNRAALEGHFKTEGLAGVSEWYAKRQGALAREDISRAVREFCEEDVEWNDEWVDGVIGYLQTQAAENSIPSSEILSITWNSLMNTFEWTGKADQLLKVKSFLPVLEPFSKKPTDQVGLIIIIQLFCYDEQKAMKSFPAFIKMIWEKDIISDEAFIYWFDKGAKPQGKEFFLKSTQGLYDHVSAEDEDDDDE